MWPHVKYHSGDLPRGAEENYKKPQSGWLLMNQHLNLRLPRHDAGVLTTCPHSIQCHLFIIIFILANSLKNLLFKPKVHTRSMKSHRMNLDHVVQLLSFGIRNEVQVTCKEKNV